MTLTEEISKRKACKRMTPGYVYRSKVFANLTADMTTRAVDQEACDEARYRFDIQRDGATFCVFQDEGYYYAILKQNTIDLPYGGDSVEEQSPAVQALIRDAATAEQYFSLDELDQRKE